MGRRVGADELQRGVSALFMNSEPAGKSDSCFLSFRTDSLKLNKNVLMSMPSLVLQI